MQKHYAVSNVPMTRRGALQKIGGGFGLVGLSAMTGQSLANAATSAPAANPLSVKAPHYPAKAKNVIFLFLNGGVSHMDTFDPKPMLDKYHGKPLPGGYKAAFAMYQKALPLLADLSFAVKRSLVLGDGATITLRKPPWFQFLEDDRTPA